jgi:hypothetical protein
MITADQITCHLVGDYVLQSDWMANQKTKSTVAAGIHAVSYSLPFLFLRPSLAAWAVIVGTHLLIDRFRLARYLVWAKNWLGAPRYWWRGGSLRDSDLPPCDLSHPVDFEWWHQPTPPFSECSATGYPPNRPAWMAVWLLIIADNVCHILLNAAALRWL